jgi:hypothetical protein
LRGLGLRHGEGAGVLKRGIDFCGGHGL